MDFKNYLEGKKAWLAGNTIKQALQNKSQRSRIYFESNLNYSHLWGLGLSNRKQFVPWVVELKKTCFFPVVRFASVSLMPLCLIQCEFQQQFFCTITHFYNPCVVSLTALKELSKFCKFLISGVIICLTVLYAVFFIMFF